jgi:hypothetical protein
MLSFLGDENRTGTLTITRYGVHTAYSDVRVGPKRVADFPDIYGTGPRVQGLDET